MKWRYKSQQIPQNLEELRHLLIESRNIENQETFFHPLHPEKISLESVSIDNEQMRWAVRRILEAIKQQQKIVVFGDYDADGITATAIVWLALRQLGARNVMPFIPHREKHGYGISDRSLDDLLDKSKENEKPDLIVTVDNGIVAHQAIARVKKAGIDIIVTDHHQPEEKLPEADAIVHSTKLCGASVAWMLVREVFNQASKTNNDLNLDPNKYLDLVGIGTIADQVPLKEANRSFAIFGLEALRKTNRVGLQELFNLAGIDQADIDTYHVNYVIAPRINAMGRLEHGLDALRLLCSEKRTAASQRAAVLQETNNRRQEITYDSVEAAQHQAQLWQDEHLIIVHSQDYHEGVIGLIAGKLSEKFYKPAIAISIGDQISKASARSVIGVNIVELIRQVREDLLEVGGHPMAAGFGFETSKLETVTNKLKNLARKTIDKDLLQPLLNLECKLPFELIDQELVEMIDTFSPFGSANRKPVFSIENVLVRDIFTIGKEKQHLKLIVEANDTFTGLLPKMMTCLAWGKGELENQINPGDSITIAGILDLNQWNGKTSIQIVVKDIAQTP